MKTGSKPSVSRSAPKVSRPRTTGVKAKPQTAPTSKPKTAGIQPKDKVTLSGKTEAPVRSTTPDPSRMFNEPSEEVGKGSSVHSEHDANTGEFSAGAEAHSRSVEDKSRTEGNREITDREVKEARAGASVSGNLSEGRVKAEAEAGAIVEAQKASRVSGETSAGPLTVRGEAGAHADVKAEAGVRGSAEVDLKNGRVNAEGRAALGVKVEAGADAAVESEAFGVKSRQEGAVAARTGAHAEVQGQFRADENGISASGGGEAKAEATADAKIRNTLSTDAGSVSTEGRVEASAFAEAHAKGHFESTQDTLAFGGDVGASAATQLAAEGTIEGETANGSSFKLNGGANTGSVGLGINGNFARRPGQTSIGLGSSGSLAVVGGHLGGQVTVADKDIAEASVAPLRAGSAVTGALGDGAQVAGAITESTRQSAHSRQDFLNEMGRVPTGNFIADAGIAGTRNAHGALTNAVDTADRFVDTAALGYNIAERQLNNTANQISNRVEQTVGQTMERGTRTVNNVYQEGRRQAGRAAVKTAIFGLNAAQSAREFGSWLNPFD